MFLNFFTPKHTMQSFKSQLQNYNSYYTAYLRTIVPSVFGQDNDDDCKEFKKNDNYFYSKNCLNNISMLYKPFIYFTIFSLIINKFYF